MFSLSKTFCLLASIFLITSARGDEFNKTTAKELETVTSIPMEKRERVFAETKIFPRFQSKYSLIQNYLDSYCEHIFTDRPLFFDRSLAGKDNGEYNKMNVPGSFIRQLETALEFTDGLGLLHGLAQFHLRTMKGIEYADKAGIKNSILLETGPEIFQSPAILDEFIEAGLASQAVVKHQGKLLVSSYWGEKITPEEWAKNLERIHKKYPDKTLFMVEVRATCYDLNGEYLRGEGKISQAVLDKARAKMRSYLDVADGIMFVGSNHITSDSQDYPAHIFGEDSYKKIIVPLMVSVVNEPAYRNKKLLALSAHKTYFYRTRIWDSVDEEGTKALRSSLAIAMSANPDYLVMPEWNEINENTHIEPLISDAQSNRRIINAFRNNPTPEISRAYPNIILSFRQDNALGEILPIELLGLPDPSAAYKDYQVQLKLLDADGKIVREFSPEKFTHEKITEKIYTLASEDFAGHRFIIPELLISTGKEKLVIRSGLPQIRFCTPPNYNLKYVKIPLRDLPNPEKISVAWHMNEGKIQVDGKAEVNGLINSIELLANDVPLSAIDPKNEYKIPTGQVMLRLYRWVPEGVKTSNDSWRITAIKGSIAALPFHQISLSGMSVPKQNGQMLKGQIGGGADVRDILFFASPDSQLEIEMRGEKITVAVSSIIKNQLYRHTQDNAITWGLETVTDLPEIPFPLRVNSTKFVLTASPPNIPNPVYQLRLVTMDGQVFRSLPFYPEKLSGKTLEMPVYSRTEKSVLKVNVPEEFTHSIAYRFTPEAGNALLSIPAYKAYYASCGGYNSWVRHAKSYSPDKTSPPLWQKDGKDYILNFENGSYIFLPGEAFSRAAFTLNLSFNVNNVKDMQFLNIAGESFQLKIKNGALSGFLSTSEGKFPYSTGQVIEPDKWYNLSIKYNLNSLTLTLDGKTIGNFPANGVFLRGSILLIGNYTAASRKTPFTGKLRSLSIDNF